MIALEALILAALLIPVGQAALIALLPRPPGLRDAINILGAVALAWVVVVLIAAGVRGEVARVQIAEPLPGVSLAFELEPLGLVFAGLIAVLGVLSAPYASGYLRATEDRQPARLLAFLALATAAGMAVALSANLFTFFIFYEALTLAAFPLVTHTSDPESRRAGRLYLWTLLGASMALLLPAVIWTYALAGKLDFVKGGLLAGSLDPITGNILLVLFVFGLAKAALMPMHRWLPASMTAPHPVCGLLHGVVVVKAGAFGVMKVVIYIFGDGFGYASQAAFGILVISVATMILASLLALSKDDLKQRLAYSTIAQLAAVTAGAMLANAAGVVAAALQLLAHGAAKLTLFMTAGAVFAATGRTKASELAGLGRKMPWTFAAFAVAALSVIGAPPLAGAWAKLWLIAAAAEAQYVWAALLAGLSALLSFAYLGPLAAKALFAPAPADPFVRTDGAPILLVVPSLIAAVLILALLFLVSPVADFLWRAWGMAP